MPSLVVLAPILIPLVAAALITAFGLAGVDLGRISCAVGAWGAVAALLLLWLSVRSTQDLNLGPLGFGSPLLLRIDAVGFAFGLMVTVPAAVLLSLQPRTWQEATVALVGVAAAITAIESGGVVLCAFAGGTAATLAVVQLDTEDVKAPRPSWGLLLGSWLALSWAGVIFEARVGTDGFAAVPVANLTGPVFALIAVAALGASGLFPWRSWPAIVWSRPSLRAAGMSVATLYPLGFYLLVRAYEIGDGRYPQPGLNVVLGGLGVAVALSAAIRAQGAATRRDFLAEVIPGFGGFALMMIALGTPLGLVAGLLSLATASALTACLALLPDRAGLASLFAVAAAAGLPPGFAFGARVLGLEATFEAGNSIGLIGLAGAATWVVWIVAAARAIGLPGGPGHAVAETFPRIAMAIAAVTIVAGPALAAFQSAFANPAQGKVMTGSSAGSVAGGLVSVETVSTVLPALSLFIPLLAIAVLVYAFAGTTPVRGQTRPALFTMPGRQPFARLWAAVRATRVPDQYRSIVDLRAIESAAAGGHAVLWLAALAALVFAVTRQ
ncbi:MAG TPA: hypothetical protein VLU92_00915 [Candidatus Dormibacteraeota bacterium]|nr:hypothetical protein [Candidatus Dormibacteraeota bacterium]